jgi:hypothetical protein
MQLIERRSFGVSGFGQFDAHLFQIHLGGEQIAFHRHALLVQIAGDAHVFLGSLLGLLGHLDIGARRMHPLIGHQDMLGQLLAGVPVARLGGAHIGLGGVDIRLHHAAVIDRHEQLDAWIDVGDRVRFVEVFRRQRQGIAAAVQGVEKIAGAEIVEGRLALAELQAEGAQGVIGMYRGERQVDARQPVAFGLAHGGLGLVDLGLGDSKFRILGQGHFHGLPEFHSLAQRQTRQQPGENQRRQAPQAGGCLTTIMRGHGIDP